MPDPETLVVIDGYHGFMAVPTDLVGHRGPGLLRGRRLQVRHGRRGRLLRPLPARLRRTAPRHRLVRRLRPAGRAGRPARCAYAPGGARLLGATFDPTGLYRLNAVQRWLDGLGVTVADIHAHVGRLQGRFLAAGPHPELVPPVDGAAGERGHFLTFRLPDAAAVHGALHAAGVITDYRDDRLRIGFGLYHDDADIDELLRRLTKIPGWP